MSKAAHLKMSSTTAKTLAVLVVYAALFTAFRHFGVFSNSNLFHWLFLAFASFCAVLASRVRHPVYAALVFGAVFVLGEISALLVLLTVFGDSL